MCAFFRSHSQHTLVMYTNSIASLPLFLTLSTSLSLAVRLYVSNSLFSSADFLFSGVLFSFYSFDINYTFCRNSFGCSRCLYLYAYTRPYQAKGMDLRAKCRMEKSTRERAKEWDWANEGDENSNNNNNDVDEKSHGDFYFYCMHSLIYFLMY